MLNKKIHVYTVSEINQSIKQILESNFGNIWIEGEISNLRQPTSGHIYFSLKDSQSQIRAVVFSSFSQKTRFKLEDGIHIIASCSLSLYEKRGEYQVIINYLEPKGIGALQLAFEQLKKKLFQEGLFDPSHKKLIPVFPKKIAIVTSPTGAAVRDLINVISRRAPWVKLVVYGVKVQGEGAREEIAEAIFRANQDKEVDLLIVGRGGGSIEDLWPFNEEIVARSIYNSDVPVISAVGHEIDFCISDFTADLRAPTPSAAGELAVPDRKELLRKIDDLNIRIRQRLNNFIDNKRLRLDNLINSPSFSMPIEKVNDCRLEIDDYLDSLQRNYLRNLELKKRMFHDIMKKLNILNPLNVLARGYSLSYLMPEGNLLKDTCQIKVGDKIKVRLCKGEMLCLVEKTNLL
ncbi:MAG: exodeoxyribonuclease VII large subunit [bacterium]|nr:exodeoxyribonuclease VII large subunit [bacterium]